MHRTPRQISDELLSYTKKEGYYAPLLGKRPIPFYWKYLCAQYKNFIGSFYGFFMRATLRSAFTRLRQHGQEMRGCDSLG